jgi:hypothetical protein
MQFDILFPFRSIKKHQVVRAVKCVCVCDEDSHRVKVDFFVPFTLTCMHTLVSNITKPIYVIACLLILSSNASTSEPFGQFLLLLTHTHTQHIGQELWPFSLYSNFILALAPFASDMMKRLRFSRVWGGEGQQDAFRLTLTLRSSDFLRAYE